MRNRDRDTAILWARDILKTDFVVLDTETTGLGHDDVAVQIGIVDKTAKILLDTYVKPWKPIPAEATAVHGITDEMVASAPRFSEILPELDKVLKGQAVLIYNASYDIRMLRQSAKHETLDIKVSFWGLNVTPSDWCCVMKQFAKFYGEWNDYHGSYRWQKLTTAARHFSIDTTGAHGAAADALMTLYVVEGMAQAKLSTEGNDA